MHPFPFSNSQGPKLARLELPVMEASAKKKNGEKKGVIGSGSQLVRIPWRLWKSRSSFHIFSVFLKDLDSISLVSYHGSVFEIRVLRET